MVTADREKMITDNIGLVHAIANRFRSRGADYDDLFQAGCVGLIKAVDRFDESRGFMFSTYAVPVIMGEIRRLFRDGGAVKVSRAMKEQSLRVQTVRDEFMRTALREPTVTELSELTGIDVPELCEILNVITPVLSLSVDSDEGGEELDIPVDNSDSFFERMAVRELLSRLSAQEQQLLQLRYYQGKTQCEVAAVLGISQVQVSRREKAILNKLRSGLL
ncbi:MAG: sigma-70 family RNA polymerase sigma factor [Eubacterium sp.]|nr:sigma-70 family RNA polymerase sigma factor [Eubacterium sp.]